MPLPKLTMASIFGMLSKLSVRDMMSSSAIKKSKGSTPNKYEPHQGKREVARRLKRIKGES